MSGLTDAQAQMDKEAGEPDIGYITPEDMKDAFAALWQRLPTTGNTAGQVMVWNGSDWVPGTAAQIASLPTGTVGSANVQAAIAELANEKADKGGFTATGPITLPGPGTLPNHAATVAQTALWAADVPQVTHGSAVSITHNLGTLDVQVQVVEKDTPGPGPSAGAVVPDVDVRVEDPNTVSLSFKRDAAANTYRVTVRR